MADLDFRALFETAPGNYLVLTPDARFTIVAATDVYLRMTHTARDAIVGRGVFEVFADDAGGAETDSQRDLRASLERVVATGQADQMPVFRYAIPHADSGEFVEHFWSVHNLPVLGADGRVRWIINRAEDVTDLVRAASRQDDMQREIVQRTRELDLAMRELRKAHHRLGDLDRAKTRFFNDVSHEFRTPLTLMLPELEELQADAAMPVAQRERIQQVNRHALRLLKLVNTLLDFSQFEAGRTSMRFVPTDLAALTREVAGAFETPMSKSGLAYAVDCPPLTTPIHADHDLWEKIVLNLLSNAYKYTLRGGVTVRLRETPAAAVLEVEDTGAGIPEDQLPSMFQRFHRVRDTRSRSFEGTGIGLALVAELVKAHGGTVEVRSQHGVGSCFVVTVPKGTAHLDPASVGAGNARRSEGSAVGLFVAEASRWADGAEADATTPTVPTGSGAKPAVLVVDDNPDIRRMIERMLASDYAVTTARDGDEALAAIASAAPALVVTDSQMPRLDGAGLIEALKRDPRTRGIPVLMLSGRAEENLQVSAIGAAADDCLLKPFSGVELRARIGRLIGAAQERAALAREVARLRQDGPRG